MEEKQKQEISVNTEELKQETVETVKQVKESMKNVNVQEETEATKGFITEMFKNPIGKIKEIANDASNRYFITAIIVVIIWVLVALLGSISFKYFSLEHFGQKLLGYVKTMLAPVLTVAIMSLIIYLMNKKSKKSLVTVLTAVTTAKLPVIIARVIGLLTLFSHSASTITSKVTSLCTIISTVLMYFTIRELYGEKDEKVALKNFVIIEAIYVVAALIISYLGIYI